MRAKKGGSMPVDVAWYELSALREEETGTQQLGLVEKHLAFQKGAGGIEKVLKEENVWKQ